MASTSIPTLQQRLRELLRERSITHGDFTLASGRRATFYIDARRTTMSGEGLVVIGALGLARLTARGWAPDLRSEERRVGTLSGSRRVHCKRGQRRRFLGQMKSINAPYCRSMCHI